MTMLSSRQVFTRPIEILDNTTLTFGGQQKTFPAGVYANVYTLCHSANNGWSFSGLDFEFVINETNLHVTIKGTGNTSVAFGTAGSNIKEILGFAGDFTMSAGSPYYSTATYLSSHVWLPARHYADQGEWHPIINERYSGRYANNGVLAGYTHASRLYHRQATYMHELAANVAEEFTSISRYNDLTWDRFCEESIVVAAEENNVCCKGFYWWEDCQNILASLDSTDGGVDYYNYATDIQDAGGINFWYDSSPDEYVFVMPELTRGRASHKSSLPSGRLYYDVDVDVHTASIPTDGWKYTVYVE